MTIVAPRVFARVGLTLLFLSAAIEAQPMDQPATGKLLVAREDLRDPNFERTVVLLVAYGDTGAMGVVLNRQSHMRLDHLLPHIEGAAALEQPVFLGGPVATRQATILFSSDEPDGRARVLESVYVTGDLRLLERLVTKPRPDEKYRVYAGHAGWAPGQLDAEMVRLGWHVLPASAAAIFGETDDLWETLIRRTRSRIADARPAREPSRSAR
jgi:putative transcriptional regulator